VVPFTPEVLAAAAAHASAELPNEACGLVRAGRYVPCRNVHPCPGDAFEVDPDEAFAASAAGDLEGVVHSHPEGPWHPSADDMASQAAMGVPWAILVPGPEGAELACILGGPRPALFDGDEHRQRAFLHGVSDCYEIARDWFREIHLFELPDIPREWMWWRNGQNLYLEGLEAAGFRVLSQDTSEYAGLARPGDCFLRRVDSPVPNHGGVYLGGGLCLEQMPRSLSQRRPIGPALHVITHWLRHEAL
jgi:proteasome lid subunit RPN8/RPN11